MKITKTQLENLIKEETELTLLEEGMLLNEGLFRDIIQTALDAAGLFPAAGEVADAANLAIYAYNEEYFYAFLSLISLAPVAGDLIGKGTKAGIWFAKTFPKASKYTSKFLIFLKALKQVCRQKESEIKATLEEVRQAISDLPDYYEVGFGRFKKELNLGVYKNAIFKGLDAVVKIIDIFAGSGPGADVLEQLSQIDDELTDYIGITPTEEEAPLSESKKINKRFLENLILECLREEKLLN